MRKHEGVTFLRENISLAGTGREIPIDQILESIRDAVVTLDAEWRVTYANRAAARFAGSSAAELLGRSTWDIFPRGPGNAFFNELQRAAAERTKGRFEGYCSCIDRWLDSDIYPTAEGLLVITRDVTAAKRRARDGDERLRLALSSAKAGVWECDIKTRQVRASPELEAVHGVPPGTFGGDKTATIFSLVHPEDREKVHDAFFEAVQNQRSFSNEFRIIWPDGSIRFLSSRGTLLCDDMGQPVSVLGISVDITAQKRDARQVEQKLEQMHVLSVLAEAVNRAEEPSEIYLTALHGLKRAVGSDRASVLIFDSDGVMRFKAWTGLSDQYREAAAGHTPWKHGEAGALPITVPDVCEESSLAGLLPVLQEEGIRSVAFVPLLGRGGVIGKFMLYYDQPHEFQAEELQVAQTIAAQVAFAAERKAAEAALQDSEERFRATFFQAAVGITQADVSGRFQLVNDRFCQILGYAREEMVRMNFLDITHPDDRDTCGSKVRDLAAGKIPAYTTEKRFLHKNGSCVWARVNVSVVRDQNGESQYFIGVVEDTTERILAERALRDSEQRLTLALSAARLRVWDCDLEQEVVTVSPPYVEGHDARRGFAEYLAVIHPDDRERMERLGRACVSGQQDMDAECRTVLPDGRVQWEHTSARAVRDDSGNTTRLIGVSLDITERKRTETALRESEELFRNLADTAPVMMWIAGPDKLCTFFNKTWLSFTGRTVEQEMGNGWAEGIHPDDAAACYVAYCEAFDARRNFHIEYRLRRADAEYRWVMCSGVPRFASDGTFAGYIGSDVDITELKRTQAEAVERDKLESLRVLTNGIAHDFNNLLGSVLAIAEMGELEIAAGLPAEDEFQKIKSLAVRASEIVRELMIYSGQDQAELDTLDLSSLTEEMLELLKVSISKHAVLKTHFPKGLPLMRGNATQLRQVVMNLIINASEALGEQDGVIRIASSLATGGRNLPDGDYLRLSVSDTGGGITDEHKARIFDPFFSTKFAGRGLGLAVVQGIVRAHGGLIQLDSTPGQGTTLELFFPCFPGTDADRTAVATGETSKMRDDEITVLFVEDEDSLRDAVSKMLVRKGFVVIGAADGSIAINLLRRHPGDIDVVLLDMTLPGTPSREIIAEAQRIRPAVKIVLTSAYSREMVAQSVDSPAVRGFIRKPFQFSELLHLLEETLG